MLAKIGALPAYYRTDHTNGWLPDLDHIRSLINPRTRALVVIDPNNPTGAIYPDAMRRALIELAEAHGLVILADEVYGDLAYDGPVPPMAALDNDAPIISYSSLSKAYLAPGWRAGWMAVGSSPRLDPALAAIKKLADGRLCSPGPMQYAVTAALTGDRSHQVGFRQALRERAAVDDHEAQRDSRHVAAWRRAARSTRCRRWSCRQGKTDVDYVLGLLRAKGILVVYGSGFGTAAEDGFFRVVFLASPAELGTIYDDMADFTRTFLQ